MKDELAHQLYDFDHVARIFAKTEADPSDRRRPTRIPHCDCKQANELYFGFKLVGSKEEGAPYTMVPATATNDGRCAHCGHTCLMQPEADLTHARANYENHLRLQAKRAESKAFAVKGRNVSTGEEIEFPTAKAAYQAGYGAVGAALRMRNGKLRDWRWEKVVA